MLLTTEGGDAGADPSNTANSHHHETAKSKTSAKRTALLAYATNSKNPFVVNALPVSNVCAHVATKVLVLAYCCTKLICILLPLYIIC